MQISASMTFENELGNQITMMVSLEDRGITVLAAGPDSLVEHTWTPCEMSTIISLVNQITRIDADQKRRKRFNQ